VYANAGAAQELDVDVRDNDSAGLVVTPTNGSTVVAEGVTDTYSIRLTKAPTASVTVTILTDGKTLVTSADPRFAMVNGKPTVTFTAANWNQDVVLTVSLDPDWEPAQAGAQPVQAFPVQPHVVADVQGPLVIEGGVMPNRDRTIKTAVKLPTELDTALTLPSVQVDEAVKTDRLNVFNDGSLKADTGTHGAASANGLNALNALWGQPVLGTEFANIGGLGMGGPLALDFGSSGVPNVQTVDGGITYHGVEIVDVLLGQNDDSFTVSKTVDGTITVVQGGGGNDTLVANGTAGGTSAPLVLFGDTSQDGRFYNSTTALVGASYPTTDVHPNPALLGRQFAVSGNDVINASAAGGMVTIYGGAGNDTLVGSADGYQNASS
jgi:hypothetical protein